MLSGFQALAQKVHNMSCIQVSIAGHGSILMLQSAETYPHIWKIRGERYIYGLTIFPSLLLLRHNAESDVYNSRKIKPGGYSK